MELAGGDPSILKMLRLLSVLRVFKMLRHLPQTQVLVMAAKESWRKLLLPLFFLAIFVVIFSAAMFEYEKGLPQLVPCDADEMDEDYWQFKRRGCNTDVNSEHYGFRWANIVGASQQESAFEDIFRSVWVVFVTMTSVGYGGVSPITKVGKMIALVAMIFGTFYMAMPLTIVGSQFYKYYLNHKKQERVVEKMKAELWGTNVAGTSGHSLFDDHTIVADEDPDRPRDLTKEEMKLLQFYCRNKRRLIDVQARGRVWLGEEGYHWAPPAWNPPPPFGGVTTQFRPMCVIFVGCANLPL